MYYVPALRLSPECGESALDAKAPTQKQLAVQKIARRRTT